MGATTAGYARFNTFRSGFPGLKGHVLGPSVTRSLGADVTSTCICTSSRHSSLRISITFFEKQFDRQNTMVSKVSMLAFIALSLMASSAMATGARHRPNSLLLLWSFDIYEALCDKMSSLHAWTRKGRRCCTLNRRHLHGSVWDMVPGSAACCNVHRRGYTQANIMTLFTVRVCVARVSRLKVTILLLRLEANI